MRTRPPGMTCGRFLINTVQSLDRHTKSALSFDTYSQQFTLCYFPVKSPLLRIRSQNFLRHRSVSGAPPPEKNPGSPPPLGLVHVSTFREIAEVLQGTQDQPLCFSKK